MKRIVFKLKHEPRDESKENQEWRNYSVGEFPKLPTWVHFAGFAILGIGIAAGYWLGHPGIGFLAGFAACIVLVIKAHPLRCPQCKGRVIIREVEEENGYRRRFFHDCPVCRISWRCQKPHWHSSD
jgi:hypothetical protein